MNCVQARDRFAELLDQRLESPVSGDLRAHLASCPACQRDFASLRDTLDRLDAMPTPKPSPRLRAGFYAMLEDEKRSAAASPAQTAAARRPARRQLWRWILSPLAAGGLLVLGFLAGQYAPSRQAAPATTPAANTTDAATQQELADLRKKVDSMTQLVGYSLLQQQPAGERLKGVLAAQQLNGESDEVITKLINTLALDPSTNVRLSALEALYQHADKDVVRAGVLASLTREQNPLVQVSMIDFLVAARDREAAPTLQDLARSDKVDRSVRDAAQRALVQI
ncbi:MAG: HEAT repeat domain-containing protein [Opitutaceae bacterium]|nr:HEAT repeat domain-containing protein [Opitutaceae bacterium]